MRFALRSTFYSSWLTRFAVSAALFVFGEPAFAQNTAQNYHLNLHGSPQSRTCNESWFRSRFELIRGQERFRTATDIDIAVMSDGNSGFVLDVFLRSRANGDDLNSTRRNYEGPVECSRVVADAAEITLEMMRGRLPRPMTIPESNAYNVEISAPDNLNACRDNDEWLKFFEFYRADRQFWGLSPKGIQLTFEQNADKRIFVKVVLREPDGRPMRDKARQPLNDIRLGPYAEGTECTQALAYSAQTVAGLLGDLLQPEVIPKPPLPVELPTRALEFGSGFVVQEGFLLNFRQMGFQVLAEFPILSTNSLVARFQIMDPHNWKRNDGLEVGSVNSFALLGLGFCQNQRYGGFCTEIRAGRAELDFSASSDFDKNATVWPVAIGPNLFLHTGPLLNILKLRVDGNLGLNAPIGVRTGSRILLPPSYLSWSIQLSLTVPLLHFSSAK